MITTNLRWGVAHQKLAKKILSDNVYQKRRMPKLPRDIIDWINVARPQVDGKTRSFLATPFWIPIYNDSHDFQMILHVRQILHRLQYQRRLQTW